jgi:hypothetical protein
MDDLPRFGFDDRNYGVIVAGRHVPGEVLRARSRSEEFAATVRLVAARARLPLALVHMPYGSDDAADAEPYESSAVVGLVTAFVEAGQAVPLARYGIDPARIAEVPGTLWDELATRHDVRLTDATSRGVFFAPAGWTVAHIYSGTVHETKGAWSGVPGAMVQKSEYTIDGSKLVMVASEDLPPHARLDIGRNAELLAEHASLVLTANYA